MRAWVVCVGLCACGSSQFVQECPPLDAPIASITLTAPPFQQIRRAGIRMRIETAELVDLSVALGRPEQRCDAALTPEADRAARTWSHPEDPSGAEVPDVSGEYTLHTLTLNELPEDGSASPWAVATDPDERFWPQGTVRRAPLAGESARLAFVGSLAPPVQGSIFQVIDAQEPAMTVLTGDLQRTDIAESTWARLMADLARLNENSLLHTVPGEMDAEEGGEEADVYVRWFGGQGRPGSTDRYYSMDVAGVRLLMLDSEDDRLGVPDSKQWRWMVDELDYVGRDDSLREAIVVLHAGPWSLAEQVPALDLRPDFVPFLGERGVRLVVSGHGHLYERFEHSGVTFVSDGGGGAALSEPDHRLDRDPESLAARVGVSATHGHTTLDIDEVGALTVVRWDATGSELDRVELPAPE